MEQIYIDQAKVLKALSDPKRLRIIDMLSCGELCACHILEAFDITQPTLSHDMKVLTSTGLVIARQEGKWMHYSLNEESARCFYDQLKAILSEKDNCICHREGHSEQDCSPSIEPLESKPESIAQHPLPG